MENLISAIAALDKKGVLKAVEDGIKANRDPIELIEEARLGLERIGDEYDKGNYFLMELMRAAQIFKEAASLIDPKIKACHGHTLCKGKVLIGTVAGDVHDLGKSIVVSLLQCVGFEVIDLGVDVPIHVFVEKTKKDNPQVVGMSGLLTTSIPVMHQTIRGIEKAGLRKGVKVIVGGGIVGEVEKSVIGADYTALSANEGVKVIKDWVERLTSNS
ncbi:MAG: B12-binding domain-containing protein [Candidatus Aminicenantaceae bacterium]